VNYYERIAKDMKKYLPVVSEENHENYQSGELVFWIRTEHLGN
jgi:hypothetical protein